VQSRACRESLWHDGDDFSQAAMARDVFEDAARGRFIGNVRRHILGRVKEEALP
jgi:hypothetical protein